VNRQRERRQVRGVGVYERGGWGGGGGDISRRGGNGGGGKARDGTERGEKDVD